MAEVGDQPVGDVDGGGGEAAQRPAQRQARARRAVAVDQGQRLVLGDGEAAQDAQAQRGIAERAGDPDVVAGPRTRAQQRLAAAAPCRGWSATSVSGPGVETVSPPSRWQPKRCWSASEPGARTGASQASSIVGRAGQRREVAQRLGPHGGEVGEIDPQQLAGDQLRRVVGQEMDVGDDGVLGDDQLLAGRHVDQRRVVGRGPSAPG